MSEKSSTFAVAKVKKHDNSYFWKRDEIADGDGGSAYIGLYDREGNSCVVVAGVEAGVRPA